MPNRDTVDGWLRMLPEVEGPLEIDDKGQCFLTVDGVICIVFVPETVPVFHLYNDVLPLPVDVGPNQLEAILTMNLFAERTGGATLALDPEPRSLVLTYQRAIDDTDATTFANILSNFAEAALRVKQDLVEILAPAEKEASESISEYSISGREHIITP